MSRQHARPQPLTDSCTSTLSGWAAPSQLQGELRNGFLEHLRHQPEGWARQCRAAHLTASALVCAPAERLVLLILHAKVGRWLQTGGHLEPGDLSLSAAAIREAEEECGLPGLRLDPDPLLLSRHGVSCGGEPTVHLDVQFLAAASRADAPTLTGESLDVGWFPLDGLPVVDESVQDLVGAAALRLGWS